MTRTPVTRPQTNEAMDSTVPTVIQQAKALREEHSYDEALRKVNELDSSELSPTYLREIAAEKAAILSEQGYIDLAEIALKDALKFSRQTGLVTQEERIRHALLEGREAILMIDSKGMIAEALKVRDNIKSTYLLQDSFESPFSEVLVLSATIKR